MSGTDTGPRSTSQVVDDLVDVVLGAPRRMRREEVAHRAGVPLEDARRLWRAMGFADVGDAVAFTDEDVDALRLIGVLLDRGVLDRSTAVDVARSLGQTMSRLADWQTDTFGRLLAERGVLDVRDPLSDSSAAAVFRELEVLLPALERLLVHGWRRQLAAALERGLGDAEQSAEVETGHLTVGFADQVGFTRLARRMEEDELAALVERFESRSADVVAKHGGRIIKTLGDEIFFVAADPEAAAEVSLHLLTEHMADDTMPRLRIGLATGTVVTRRGDVFGTTVNLASRLTALARPDSVLVDEATAAALEGSHYAVGRLPARPVRGLGTVRPAVLRRR
ncbi:MAG TPA: adenylate/guanylate cyclase domain-containing protein [Candidatus Angelobacter sp.]|nr:adenylate/guanylate cyclase domain-containing protein [Candidatus Angelobacter sp.]